MNFYLIRLEINVVVRKITLVPQDDLLQGRRCIFSIGACNQFLLGCTVYFLHGKPYLSLKKRYSVNYWGHVPLVPLQCLRLCTIPPRATANFSEKNSLRTSCYCFECNVKHELPNFDVHLMLSNLTLVSNKNEIRERYLYHLIQSHLISSQSHLIDTAISTDREGFKLCWDVIFEWFY